MSESQILKAESRKKLGTRDARKLRSAGRIPATLQAEGAKPHLDFSLDERDFLTSRRRHVHLYDIDLGGELEAAVVRELQWDTFGESIVHIEFKRVQRDVETETEVQLEFVGQPKQGLLNHILTHVPVRSLPALIPDSIEVRIAGLSEGVHIRASDLVLPEGVTLAIPPDTEVAVISAPRGEVEVEPSAPLAPGEVEIIGERKSAEEDED